MSQLGDQINAGGPRQITSSSFAAKFRSKSEVYLFLTVEAGKYLPPIDNCTIYWLKDLVSGKKKALNGADVVHIKYVYALRPYQYL